MYGFLIINKGRNVYKDGMTLYSANVLDLATPVNAKKNSGGRKRKSDALAEKNDTAPEIATETVDLPPQPATKKVLSEKQVAALVCKSVLLIYFLGKSKSGSTS